MACYHPITCWRSLRGPGASGKVPIVFQAEFGDPFSEMQVPCGQCVGCRMDKSQAWALRMVHERAEHDLAIFVTFTYNRENLPFPPSLDKRHLQLFWKRLRKNIWANDPNRDDPELSIKIKYFSVGEYGGQTNRPHYHAIIYGIDFPDKRRHKKSKSGSTIFVSDKLNELWGRGHCYIGNVNAQSAGYCARYSLKKVNGEMAKEHYEFIDPNTGEISYLQKEYLAASQGLGLGYYEKYADTMYVRDNCILNGRQAPIPKYYDSKLGIDNPEKLEAIKLRRREKALLRADDNTPSRLAVREEIKLAQVILLRRDLPDD